jgi:transcriptional antiterminator RfaH
MTSVRTDVPQWYVIHTRPKQEVRAESNLKAWGVETFTPLISDRCINPFTKTLNRVIKPLFPSYFFARFKLDTLLQKVWFTRGVHSVVGFGAGPIPVDDEVIAVMKAQTSGTGLMMIGEQLKHGDKVMIRDGPFRSVVGVLENEMIETDRISILLTSLSYQGRVIIERELVRKIS